MGPQREVVGRNRFIGELGHQTVDVVVEGIGDLGHRRRRLAVPQGVFEAEEAAPLRVVDPEWQSVGAPVDLVVEVSESVIGGPQSLVIEVGAKGLTQETESVRSRLGDQPGGVTCKATGPEKTDVPARGSWGQGTAKAVIISRGCDGTCFHAVGSLAGAGG